MDQSVVCVPRYSVKNLKNWGLEMIDVSNPANPQRVGGYDTSGIAEGVALSGNYAYVGDDTAGLQVMDVSNPARTLRRSSARQT